MLRAAAAEVAAKQATTRLADAAQSLSGLFAINKPPGISCAGLLDYFKRNVGRSHDAIPFAEHFEREHQLRQSGKKIFRRRYALALRVGHGGTLDVEAAGVMVVGINRGCKQLGAYLSGSKTYLANARLGASTDTQDAEGLVVGTGDAAAVTAEAVEAVLPQFTGRISQQPPMFSAVRVDGKRLYEYARGGKPAPVPVRPRAVDVHSLRMTYFSNPALGQRSGQQVALPPRVADYFAEGRYRWNPDAPEMRVGHTMAPYAHDPRLPALQLFVRSGGGVYVRTLIHDLGALMGCGATMVSLVRLAQGPFRVGRDTIDAEDLPYIDRIISAMRHADGVIQQGGVPPTQS
ncbi:pseudouridine synthase pus4 [Coemansia sp. RSA 2704]|nr:pseudouridine synthase pus4 [Coemansia sp. RSA 2704]